MPLPSPIRTFITLAALLLLAGCAALVVSRADDREAAWTAEYPPVGQFVEVEGHRIHLLVTGRARGTAPDVVLIHGANGNLRDFTFDLVDRLSGEFRVIAVDRPGLGYSDTWGEADSDPALQARVLRAAVDQVGVNRWAIPMAAQWPPPGPCRTSATRRPWCWRRRRSSPGTAPSAPGTG